ncbi:MAG: hypothetical protein WBV39_15000 [Rudaea sp.]
MPAESFGFAMTPKGKFHIAPRMAAADSGFPADIGKRYLRPNAQQTWSRVRSIGILTTINILPLAIQRGKDGTLTEAMP